MSFHNIYEDGEAYLSVEPGTMSRGRILVYLPRGRVG